MYYILEHTLDKIISSIKTKNLTNQLYYNWINLN